MNLTTTEADTSVWDALVNIADALRMPVHVELEAG